MTIILAFLGFWWQSIVGFLMIAFLCYRIHVDAVAEQAYQKRPEVIAARQKADYDKAHAYTEGQCNHDI